jgi:hypothetical protein
MAKKHKGPEIAHADLHEDEELHVTRTTPQGTQEAGVDKGYEKRDIKIRSTIRWVVGLTIGTVLTIIAMVGLVALLTLRDKEMKTETSSPLYGKNLPRRTPELLPNPQQDEYTFPWDHYRNFVAKESKELTKFGLEDENGRPALPVSVVRSLANAPARPAPRREKERDIFTGGLFEQGRSEDWSLDYELPSEGSGGTRREMSVLTR